MGDIKRRKRPARQQTWGYLTETGNGLLVLERSRQNGIQAKTSLWRAEDKPLEKAVLLADWVAQHSRGRLAEARLLYQTYLEQFSSHNARLSAFATERYRALTG